MRRTTPMLAASIAAIIAAPSVAQESLALEEIVVTAQKRAESIQDVPIAISAFDAGAIKNTASKNIDDLSVFTPGFEANNNNVTQPSYNVRGIGSNNFGAGDESSVAVYVDGVYTTRSGGALVNFADVDRVEILKGPQGTLFGRNAAAGAIHIITKKPEEENSGLVRLRLGTYGQRDFDGAFNTALSDDVFLRASVGYQKNDGIFKNGNGGNDYEADDSLTFRGALLWNAGDNTEVIVRADANSLEQSNSPGSSTNPTANPMGYDDPYGPHYVDTDAFEKRDLWGSSLEINHDLNENLTFTSITAYRTFDTLNREDEDGSDSLYYFAESDNVEEQSQFSQEFRFSYVGDDLKWTSGVSYFKEDIEQNHIIRFNKETLEQFAITLVAQDPSFAGAVEQISQIEQSLGGSAVTLDMDSVSSGLFITGDATQAANLNGWAAAVAGAAGVYAPHPSLPGCAVVPPGTCANGVTTFPRLPYVMGDALAIFLDSSFGTNFGIGAAGGGLAGEFAGDTTWTESTHNKGSTTSWGAYFDGTYSLTETLDLTFGLRYTRDSKDFTVSSAYQNTLGGIPLALAFTSAGEESGKNSWTAWTPRVALNWHVAEDVMLYATAAQGFKAGGFNSFLLPSDTDPTVAQSLLPFDEEKVNNIEAGVKSTLLDGRVRLNGSVFSYVYDGRQDLDLVDSFTVSAQQVLPVYAVRNSDLEGQGFEVDATWLVNENWILGGNYGYTETEYTSYGLFPLEDPAPAPEGDDVTGLPASSVPEHKANLFVQNNFSVGNLGEIQTNVNWNFTGERTQSLGTVGLEKIDAFQIVNARSALVSADGDWELGIWAKNLLDEEYLYGVGGTGSAIGSKNAERAAGRTYGMDFIYNF
ncbi:TonB-dependent receptor [Simiduia agarivorans]|uniref:Outer membrane receptor protein mostly Fe transport-like protein n=1 Tax=Simiduia agarivorans (strain DSM 21679 / JCM 13881 / BCRC 17597 / SA1) TaxID=1117647 RepID=K4KI62_SIMAS|nr:TonB-dependent receptor [Simiduia agarivorans]AFU98691.1 Outer membrane receptor protein mostly Fe transport-like protein [Simiduia agarivorans SA1 = DSM 21679]